MIRFLTSTAVLVSTAFLGLTAVTVFGQSAKQIEQTKGNDSFENIKDSVIKKEIAFFTTTGSFKTAKGDSFPKTKVDEIPLVKCTDSSAYFEKGNLKAIDIIVSIYSEKFDTTGHKFTYVNVPNPFLALIDNKPFWGTDGGIPKEKIKKVEFVHNKYVLFLPDSALAGLYEPNFCNILSGKQTPFCKVFRSVDNRRVYIYMSNSDGAGGYEVTWVIQDSKYLMRVVDYGS